MHRTRQKQTRTQDHFAGCIFYSPVIVRQHGSSEHVREAHVGCSMREHGLIVLVCGRDIG